MKEVIGKRFEECQYCGKVKEIDVFEGEEHMVGDFEPGCCCNDCDHDPSATDDDSF